MRVRQLFILQLPYIVSIGPRVESMTAKKQHHTHPDTEFQEPLVPTVFYDGQCPLCSREIAHYRRLRGAETLHWVDIKQNENALTAYGLQRDAAMARFHVRDASGHWQTGAWGFAELWSHLPAYRWLAQSLRTLRLLPLLDRAYSRFARWRVRRSCNSETCAAEAKD